MSSEILEGLMSPVAECLDLRSLRALTELRADSKAVQRMEALAERANEGLLTADERNEYESCTMFASFLGILQAKARRRLEAD